LYGVDPDGPVSTKDTGGGIKVPQSSLYFSHRDIQILKQTIDPCAPSDNHGIELYEQSLITL